MIVGSWNTRGLTHPSKKEAIKQFTTRNIVTIMVVLETRLLLVDSLFGFTNN